MSTPPGPILTIRVDAATASGAMSAAMSQLRAQAKTASDQMAEDWKRAAAQIRASTATEAGGVQAIAQQRQNLATLLKSELSLHGDLSNATNKQLGNYKAMTLELERQVSFLKGTGGLTAGTSAFLGQVGGIGGNLVSRLVGSLGANLFGVAGGSQLGGIAGGAATSLFAGLSPATLGIGAGVAALTALGLTLTSLAKDGGKLAVELDNMSRRLGISVDSVIRLRSASEALDIDFDSLAPGFKKLSTEITLGLGANLPAATEQAKKAGEIFKILGVDIQKAAQDPFYAIQQLAKSLGTLPDGAIKSATASQLFGKSFQSFLPVIDKLPGALAATEKSSQDLARALGVDVAHSQEALSAAMVNIKNETDALEVSLAQKLLPAITRIVERINDAFFGPSTIDQYLAQQKTQFTQYGQAEFQRFHSQQTPGALGGPQESFDAFVAWEQRFGGQGKVLENLTNSAAGTAKQSADAAAKLGDLAKIIDTTGKAAEKAKDPLSWMGQWIQGMIKNGSPAQTPYDKFVKFYPGQAKAPELNLAPWQLTGDISNSALGIPGNTPGLGSNAINVPKDFDGLLKQINQEHDDLFTAQYQKDMSHYNDELVALKGALDDQLISYQQYSAALVQVNADRNKTLVALNKQFEEQAGALFEDLVSGNLRKFSKSLEKDIENIFLQPIKNIFDQTIGGLFGSLSRTVNSPFQQGAAGGNFSLGGMFGGLGSLFGFGKNSPGGTPGFFSGGLGIGGIGGASVATMSVTAGTVIIGGIGGAGGALGGGFNGAGGMASPLLSLFSSGGPGDSLGIGSLPLYSSGIASMFPGLTAQGGGLGDFGGTYGGEYGPISGSASSGATGVSGGIGGLASLGVMGGSALLGLGAHTGGALGALEGAGGGALAGGSLGFMVAGPIGAAIGAAVGAIGGAIAGAFGGPSFQQQVATTMKNQAYYAPPSETFSFASNGSISSTLGTGFTQSGNKFGQFGLPQNTPFWANAIKGPLTTQQLLLLEQQQANAGGNQPFGGFGPSPFTGTGVPGSPSGGTSPNVSITVHAIDSKGVSDFFNENSEQIGGIINGRGATSTTSQFGSRVRSAAYLP